MWGRFFRLVEEYKCGSITSEATFMEFMIKGVSLLLYLLVISDEACPIRAILQKTIIDDDSIRTVDCTFF